MNNVITESNVGIRLGIITPRANEVPTGTFHCTCEDARWTTPNAVVDRCPECNREVTAIDFRPGMSFAQCLMVRLNEPRRKRRGW